MTTNQITKDDSEKAELMEKQKHALLALIQQRSPEMYAEALEVSFNVFLTSQKLYPRTSNGSI